MNNRCSRTLWKVRKKMFALAMMASLAVATRSAAQRSSELIWEFPVSRPHAGPLIGNGTQGLMIWGAGSQLRVTVGHNGFWDRRGSNDLEFLTTFKDVKQLLYANDAAGVERQFNINAPRGNHQRQIGGGDLVLTLPAEWRLDQGILDLSRGELRVLLSDANGNRSIIKMGQAVDAPIAWMELPESITVSCEIVPTWQFIGDTLKKLGIQAPVFWERDGVKGFVQTLPEDPSLGIGYLQTDRHLILGSKLGAAPEELLAAQLRSTDIARHEAVNTEWWREYWSSVPQVNLPDPVLQEIVDLGLYKQACLTPPQAPPAGLQGAFMESYQLPPYANDFHFNLNLQMIYMPALVSNRTGHLMPLWKMIMEWLPELRANGSRFYEHDGALLFPHAMDDRGKPVYGYFWTGTLDPACAAWMADIAWKHYRYTLDERILSEIAWPLLIGAFETYFAILDEVDDGKGGKRFSLPVTVSPEYGRAYTDYKRAWGRDASFQLAVLHRTLLSLPRAAKVLGKPIDPRWQNVQERLPYYTVVDDVWMLENQLKAPRIALWEGKGLDGSHRHHSHLALIYPFFNIIDLEDSAHKDIITHSIRDWVFKGPGSWMGWSVPWAAMIWSRLEQPDSSVRWLHIWHDYFVNEGRGTLANSAFPGLTLRADTHWKVGTGAAGAGTLKSGAAYIEDEQIATLNEKMQMEAAMGALSAVFEILVQDRENDVIAVLPAIPHGWKTFSFENLLAEGAFLVSAVVSQGEIKSITIKSNQGGPLKLRHGLGNFFRVNGVDAAGSDAVWEYATTKREVILLERR